MKKNRNLIVNEAAVELAMIKIKLYINQKFYQSGALTEEMYTKAKELILQTKKTTKKTGAWKFNHTPVFCYNTISKH